MALVRIKHGSYRNQDITNVTLPLIKDFAIGAHASFITVDGSSIGYANKIRVKVTRSQFDIVSNGEVSTIATAAPAEIVETDDEVMARIGERFSILEQMTDAVIEGDVRAVIVSGPPGVGKSYIVNDEIEKFNAFDNLSGSTPRAMIVKGVASGIGLYRMLYEYSEKGKVLVFDDCDSILYDDECLNMLKAALDSGKTRRISWHTESRVLGENGVPRSFNFEGGVIFISNLKFESTAKKLGAHLEALRSRCHYLDLTMNTARDRMLRIKQIARDGDLFDGYRFTKQQENEIVEFMETNQDKLHEISLRTAVKIADLARMNSTGWKRIATETVLRTA